MSDLSLKPFHKITETKYRKYILLIITMIFIVVYAEKIMHAKVEPVFDQKKLLEYTLSYEEYPAFESGLTSSLLVGLYNVLSSSSIVPSNAHVRIIAMFMYLLSGWILFSTFSEHNTFVFSLLFMLLLFTSRFPFLWLSSELFAGAFLMLLLCSVTQSLPFIVISTLASLFMLSKPDLIFSGIVVGFFLAFFCGKKNLKCRLINVAIFLTIAVVPILPGLLRDGLSYLAPQGRAIFSFGQHYATMVAKHQMVSVKPDPWLEWEAYFTPVWGQVRTLTCVVLSSPAKYLDFVFLSMAQSIKNFLRSNLFLLLPVSIYGWIKTHHSNLKMVSVLLLSGFIPITLLSFTHTRYIARFYPLFLFIIYLYLTEFKTTKRTVSRLALVEFTARQQECFFILCYLLFVLALQLYQLPPVFAAGHWFPD
jgi:hypothetical protein